MGTLALAAQGCSDLALPEPPDMSSLVGAYLEPDGELNGDNARDLALSVIDQVREARLHAPTELSFELVDDLVRLGGGPDEHGSSTGAQTLHGNKLDVAAVAKLRHICAGSRGDASPDAKRDGVVEVTAALDQDGLVPTIWGHLDRCRIQRGALSVELNGDIRIRFGDKQRRIGLRALKRTSFVVELRGSVVAERDGSRRELDLGLSFRALSNGELQLLVSLDDGTSVVGVFDPSALGPEEGDAVLSAGLLTRDKDWHCDINVTDASGTCLDARDPESAITW